jgi:hypothetical protein
MGSGSDLSVNFPNPVGVVHGAGVSGTKRHVLKAWAAPSMALPIAEVVRALHICNRFTGRRRTRDPSAFLIQAAIDAKVLQDRIGFLSEI